MYTANEYRGELQQVALRSEARGEARGSLSKAIDVEKNMLTAGIDIKLVISCTGLTEAQVKALQQN